MKSYETALKEMMPRNVIQALLSSRNIIKASFKLVKAKFKKSQSQLINNSFSRFTLFVSYWKFRDPESYQIFFLSGIVK